MSDKMLKFVKIGQQTPPKREVDSRKQDFNEIYDEYINEKAKEQSSRCSQCGVPFCQVHCPLSNNIPDWLKLTAEGRLKEAYELSQSTNNMPEVCGRICPQDRLCEGNCVIEQSGHGTVTIGSVEKYITDNAWEQGWVKPIKVYQEKIAKVLKSNSNSDFIFFTSNTNTKGIIAKKPIKNLAALNVKGPILSIPVSCAIKVVPQIKVHSKALNNEIDFVIKNYTANL